MTNRMNLPNHLSNIKFNNFIVKTRGKVKQVLVRMCHKMTREIKKYRNSKADSEEVISKKKKKANRLTREMKIMKKLKKDDITKFAVQFDKKPDSILNDVKAHIKLKVLVKISQNEILKKSVAEFRQKYPNWKVEIPNILRNIELKKTGMKLNEAIEKGESNRLSKYPEAGNEALVHTEKNKVKKAKKSEELKIKQKIDGVKTNKLGNKTKKIDSLNRWTVDSSSKLKGTKVKQKEGKKIQQTSVSDSEENESSDEDGESENNDSEEESDNGEKNKLALKLSKALNNLADNSDDEESDQEYGKEESEEERREIGVVNQKLQKNNKKSIMKNQDDSDEEEEEENDNVDEDEISEDEFEEERRKKKLEIINQPTKKSNANKNKTENQDSNDDDEEEEDNDEDDDSEDEFEEERRKRKFKLINQQTNKSSSKSKFKYQDDSDDGNSNDNGEEEEEEEEDESSKDEFEDERIKKKLQLFNQGKNKGDSGIKSKVQASSEEDNSSEDELEKIVKRKVEQMKKNTNKTKDLKDSCIKDKKNETVKLKSHNKKPSKLIKEKNNKDAEETVVDDFFMTKDNREYLSTVKPNLAAEQGEQLTGEFTGTNRSERRQSSNSQPKDIYRKGKKVVLNNRTPKFFEKSNRNESFGRKFQSADGKPKFSNFDSQSGKDSFGKKFNSADRFNGRSAFNSNKFEDGRNGGKFEAKTSGGHQSSSVGTGEKLHPSWEAKKRHQPAITHFKGKKIKFDE